MRYPPQTFDKVELGFLWKQRGRIIAGLQHKQGFQMGPFGYAAARPAAYYIAVFRL